jgi:hypothetical protein
MRCGAFVLCGVCLLASTTLGAPPSAEELFESKIRPVLAGTCFRCHGDQKSSAELRVDSRAALLKGGDSGPAIEPGKPEASLLLKAIRRDDDDVSAMPPDKALRADTVADFTAWIKAGAPWPEKTARFEKTQHWSFRPVREPALPAVRDEGWCRTSFDRFILAHLEAEGKRPSPAADKRTLIRRATYDLTGLPPTPEEVDAFLADEAPQAFERVIDRLLDSPRYGEHWGRKWLDVVRYADTAGENSDHPVPHAWRYRNWVIDAFNADLPYNEFIRDQIAGDLRAKDDPDHAADHIVATGYLAIARRFGHEIEKEMHLTLEDTIDTVGKSVLGLTLGCARCHDHKYDPLSTRDYYALYGIFESTRFPFPGCEPKQQPDKLVPLLSPQFMETVVKPFREKLAAADAELKQLNDQQAPQRERLKQVATAATKVLAAGDVDEGQSAELPKGPDAPLNEIAVKAGDTLQLVVLPRSNHGADSTLVELEIAEIGGQNRRWSTSELVNELPAGNPHADAHGNRVVWSFLDLQDSPRLLSDINGKINGQDSLQGWSNGDTPSVFVNRAEQPVQVWTTLPARSFFVHPGPRGPVALAWTSPIEGKIRVTGRVQDAHPGGPDGVSWRIEHIADAGYRDGLAALGESQSRIAEKKRARDELARQEPAVPVAYAVADAEAHNAKIHKRGEPTNPGDEAPRRFLEILGGQVLQNPAGSGRLELAGWLTDPANPLTARVMVNRLVQGHFGRGIVKTPNDFGWRGTPPTHPELLDHLASEFVRSGWSIKAIHRLIMRSAAYQQASRGSDPQDLFDCFLRRRLTAEELRDSLLAVSGELDTIPGQAHPFPPESSWSFSQHAPFAAEYDSNKRSVYLMQKRNRRSRFFALFDGADPNATTPVRDETTVPSQALFFMNDPFFHARATELARRIERSAADEPARVDQVYRVLFGRRPDADERANALEFLQAYAASLTGEPPERRAPQAWDALARVLLGSNEFLHVD